MAVSAAGAASGAATGSAAGPWGAAIGGVVGALGGGGGGVGGAAPSNQEFNPNTPINVAPVGLNLGEILKGYDQGAATNGGSGARMPSRYARQFIDNAAPSVPTQRQTGFSVSPVMIGGVVALGLVTYLIVR